MNKRDTYQTRIREMLSDLPEDEWLRGGDLARAIGRNYVERGGVSQQVGTMFRSGELLRSGFPPRSYHYRLNPDFVPSERDPHAGPASAYVGPAIGDGRLCPVIGVPTDWQLPEAA